MKKYILLAMSVLALSVIAPIHTMQKVDEKAQIKIAQEQLIIIFT